MHATCILVPANPPVVEPFNVIWSFDPSASAEKLSAEAPVEHATTPPKNPSVSKVLVAITWSEVAVTVVTKVNCNPAAGAGKLN